MNATLLSRRTILRGLGVSMALPWLESVRAFGDEAKDASKLNEPPTRMAILFSGCGYHRNEWWAKGEGASMELGKVLHPLNDFRDRLTFIRGLYNAEALKGNIHSSQTGNLLSGAPLAAGGTIMSGTSVDQVVAQRIGHQTKLPSLVLGCEKANPSVHKNYSMLYSSHISWSSPTTPTPLEVYPALAFDQLFADKSKKGDGSVLDAVLADAKGFRLGISRRDQQKLDEYLNSVREVERRRQRHARNAGNRVGYDRAVDNESPGAARPDRRKLAQPQRVQREVVVHARTGPHDGPVVTRDVPGEAEHRTEVVAIPPLRRQALGADQRLEKRRSGQCVNSPD